MGRHNVIPAGIMDIRVLAPRSAAAATPWYLSGGIAAANCITAYTPKGAASLATSYDNNAAPANGLADGTYDVVPGATPPGWAADTGWQFTAAVTSAITIAMAGALTWTVVFRFSNRTGGSRLGGLKAGVTYMLYVAPGWPSNRLYYYNGGFNQGGPTATAGVVGMAGGQSYFDGAADSAAFALKVGTTDTLVLFSGGEPTVHMQAAAVYNTTLSAAQMLALYTAMAAL